MASGPLDELVALHQEIGIFAIVDELKVQRERAGVPDEWLLRTLATLPFVEAASLPWSQRGLVPRTSGSLATGLGESRKSARAAMDDITILSGGKKSSCPVILIRCVMRYDGWGASLAASATCRRTSAVPAADGAWPGLCRRGPRAGRPAPCSGFGVCVGNSPDRRGLATLEQAGPQAISLLLADALYADGPRFSWLKYSQEIDALVSEPSNHLLYQDMQGLARAQLMN